VHYTSARQEVALTPAPPDLSEESVFPVRGLSFQREWTLPSCVSLGEDRVSIWDDEYRDLAGCGAIWDACISGSAGKNWQLRISNAPGRFCSATECPLLESSKRHQARAVACPGKSLPRMNAPGQ